MSFHLVEVGVVGPTVLREEADPVVRRKGSVAMTGGMLSECVPHGSEKSKVQGLQQFLTTRFSCFEGGRLQI